MKRFKQLFFIVLLLVASRINGQSVVSPYSVFGVGDLSYDGLVQNQGMGEVGIGASNIWTINHQNPAWLYRSSFSTFQVGLEGETRNFSNGDKEDGSSAAGLRYLALSFPLIDGKWSSSFGVLPFSTVNFNVSSINTVAETGVSYKENNKGKGGLSQAFFAHGLKITKELGFGVRARYIFGTIENETIFRLEDPQIRPSYQLAFTSNTSYSKVGLSTGLSYRKKISESNFLNVGATYDLESNLSGERTESIERRTGTGSLPLDTLTEKQQLNFVIPATFGFGVSYEKLNTVTVGVDLSIQNWVSSGGFENGTDEYQKSMKLALGVQLIPDYDNIDSYFKRSIYRMGFSYEQVPYLVKKVKINDFGINFGASLPVSGLSTVDFAIKLGQRGTLENGLIRERYLKFVFGATINDRWFTRWKYD